VRRLAISLATRGRPALLKETLERTLPNIRRKSTRLLVSIDDDDIATLTRVRDLPNDDRVRYSIAPREDSLGAKYNRILGTPADVYLAMVDYAPHLTKGFDDKILKAAAIFPDGIGVVFNRYANLSFPEINAVTRNLALRMGYFYPPYFPYWFVDHWLDDIARMIGRIAYVDIVIDVSKRPGTMDRREPGFWATFFDATHVIRERRAREILTDLHDPKWRKTLLERSFPVIAQHSMMINDNVRSIANWRPEEIDERYRRLKARAVWMMRALLPEIEEAAEKTQRGKAKAA